MMWSMVGWDKVMGWNWMGWGWDRVGWDGQRGIGFGCGDGMGRDGIGWERVGWSCMEYYKD